MTEDSAFKVSFFLENWKATFWLSSSAMIAACRTAAWNGARGTAILSDPVVATFYTRLATREAELGQLRLTFLRVAGKRIAFNYLLQNKGKLYAVKIGYDPEYHAYSPGNMLLNLILKDACRHIEEYDFLGGADEWKLDWTQEKREHRWLFLFRDRWRPRALYYLKFGVVPAVKRVLQEQIPRLCKAGGAKRRGG